MKKIKFKWIYRTSTAMFLVFLLSLYITFLYINKSSIEKNKNIQQKNMIIAPKDESTVLKENESNVLKKESIELTPKNIALGILCALIFILLFIIKDKKDYIKNDRIVFLEKNSRELTYVTQVTDGLRSTMKLESLLDIILKNLTTELGFDRALMYIIEHEKNKFYLKLIANHGVKIEQEELMARPLDRDISILSRCALDKTAYIITDAKNNYFCEQILVSYLDLKKFAVVPIIVRENTIGVLLVDNYFNKEEITESRIKSLNIFSNQAGVSIENARLYMAVEELAIKDGLTGLFNQRYFKQTLQAELIRAERFKHLLSIVMMDIDNFKHYNDTNGHLRGDELLSKIGEILQEQIRKTDIPCRYGGEEFTLILPETDTDESISIAERIRSTVESYPFKNREKQPLNKVTISSGIGTYPVDAEDEQELIDFADKGLYLAKRTGKNKICINPA